MLKRSTSMTTLRNLPVKGTLLNIINRQTQTVYAQRLLAKVKRL